MSMSSAMGAGVSGLAAHATRLSTISDNIANSGTHGYKRIETQFDSLVTSDARPKGSYSAGGVQASTRRLISEGGALETTTNPLDLAVSGRGMLPVTSATSVDYGAGELPLMMARTGSFRADDAGVLRTASGLVLLGWPTQPDGAAPLMSRDSIGGLEPVRVGEGQTAGDPTTRVFLGVNLPAEDTRPDASGAALPLRVEYFGNLGSSESLDLSFTPDVSDPAGMSSTWTMQVRDSAGDPASNLIGSYRITFDASQANGGSIASVDVLSGGAYDPDTGALSLQVAGGPLSMVIGSPGEASALRQLSSNFAPTNVSKNGSPAGSLTAVEVDDRGFVRASYDTGFTRTLYQIPLLDVPNPDGLQTVNGQAYKVSSTSGGFFLWDAGDGPTGSVAGYSLEASMTDVAEELTHLIATQRAYSSNAKVIQTVDEMLQETTNIKR